jgi:class 3 adenylate cyclase/TolB-like protein
MTEVRKLAAILAADVAGYSRLAGADEELILARLRTLRSDLIDPTIAVHGGRVVKRTGDGVLVEFRSVVDAVRCAVEIQLGMAERNAGLPAEKRVEYRIGVHIGDIVEESDGDLMGAGVNIAARLEGIAEPGAICLSEQAYWQVKGRLDLAVKDLGPTQLKNIVEPVRVYSLEAGAAVRAKPQEGAAGRQRLRIIAAAAFVIALVAVAAGVWHSRWAGMKAERVAVMVLPFTNLSSDSSTNQLAEAVTDGLTDALSRLGVRVVASDTAKAYAGKPIDVKQIGKDLGLRYLVRGSLQPTETRVRVSAQLIDGESGVQLWAETFDEDRADPLQMEDEIDARIMNALRMRATDIEAERAVRARPGSPMALALLCAARAGDYAAEAVDPEKRAELFKTCDEALRLDPHNGVALGVRAVWLLDGVDQAQSADREGDLKRAAEDIATLFAVNPSDPWAHALNVYLLRLEGRPEQAVAEGERSVALNPGFAHTFFYLCPAYTDAGQPAKAIDCVDKAIRLSPHDPSLYGLLTTKAGALEMLGRDAEALDWVRRSLALSPSFPIALRHEIMLLEFLGRDDEAKEAYRRYSALRGPKVSTIAELRACAAVPSCAVSERNIEALRKAGMPEQ